MTAQRGRKAEMLMRHNLSRLGSSLAACEVERWLSPGFPSASFAFLIDAVSFICFSEKQVRGM